MQLWFLGNGRLVVTSLKAVDGHEGDTNYFTRVDLIRHQVDREVQPSSSPLYLHTFCKRPDSAHHLNSTVGDYVPGFSPPYSGATVGF